jgi:hypothetical protein
LVSSYSIAILISQIPPALSHQELNELGFQSFNIE